VSIQNNATGISSKTATDAQGLYVSPSLDPGDCTVEFRATGFGKVQERIWLEVGHRALNNPAAE